MSDERTALITGATSGVGAAAAVELADRGWEVLVHGRDRVRGQTVVNRATATGGEAKFLRADFSERAAVHTLAAEVEDHTDRLDALLLNAGLFSEGCELIWDGVEEMFAVNQLAPYLLTHQLLDNIAAAPSARIVMTASEVHRQGMLDFADANDLDCTGNAGELERYGRSKLANLLFAKELADRLGDSAVTVNAFHPGFVPESNIFREQGVLTRAMVTLARIVPFAATSVEEAASTLVYLAAHADLNDITGAYFDGRTRTAPDSRVANSEHRDLIWSISAELTGLDPDWP